jgi:hypothetical protein
VIAPRCAATETIMITRCTAAVVLNAASQRLDEIARTGAAVSTIRGSGADHYLRAVHGYAPVPTRAGYMLAPATAGRCAPAPASPFGDFDAACGDDPFEMRPEWAPCFDRDAAYLDEMEHIDNQLLAYAR